MHALKQALFAGLSFLILISALVITATPVSALSVGNDEVDFITVRYDYPSSGQSTWYYTVTSGRKPAISHVTFKLNLYCLDVVAAGTWDGVDQDSLTPDGGDPEPGKDPTTGITGIKFNEGFDNYETRHYYFTVDGNYAEDSIIVASKASTGYDTAQITGPSLSCDPAVTSGSLKVKKKVYWNDATPAEQTFNICITGPSPAQTQSCKDVGPFDGDGDDYEYDYVTWNDLEPGYYTVSETNPGSEWVVEVPADAVRVKAGETKIVEVKNKYTVYDLKVIKKNEKHERLLGWNITVTNTQTSEVWGPIATTTVDGEVGVALFENLPAGEYLVCETLKPGWIALEDVCKTVTLGSSGISQVQTSGELGIQGDHYLPSPEPETVYFKNQQVGSLSVTKTVDWNGVTPTDQTFEICLSSDNLAQPSCKTVGPFNGDGDLSVTWDNLVPGSYTVSETNPGSEWDVTVTGSSVTVEKGKTKNAAVKNEYILGSLKVTKTVDWKGVTADPNKTFEICISGNAPVDPACQNVGANGGEVTWNNLVPGNYTVSETNPGSEWTVNVPAGAVAVASGQAAEASVSNVYILGGLKVTKTVDWNGVTPTDQTFEICVTGPSPEQVESCKTVGPFAGDGDLSVTWSDLKPGSYTVNEKPVGSEWDVIVTGSPVTVASGQIAEAGVKNEYILGSLKVTKTVDWNGVTADPSKTFEICISGDAPVNPACQNVGANGGEVTWNNLVPGNYTVSETNPGSEWTVNVPAGAVAVTSGQIAEASVSNVYILGSLKVTKTVDWNGVTSTDQTFEICLSSDKLAQPSCKTVGPFNGDGEQSVTWSDLIPGNYTVSETNPGSEWTVTVPAGAVAVASGQTAEATVKNEYILAGLKVTKTVDWKGVTADPSKTFEICVESQSYPKSCQSVGSNGGAVTWSDLVPGDYTVTETNPGSEWIVTVPAGAIAVASGQVAEASVSNVYKPASLGNYVWNDTIQNGVQDGDESPVPNVRVDLLNVCGGDSLANVLTDANGLYLFSNLRPGTYVVKFILPDGYVFTTANVPGNDETDSDANETDGCTPEINLEAGENDMTWDAGIYKPVVQPQPASLGNYVWEDLDQDGIQNDGQTGIANVTVELVNTCEDVTPIASTVTNGSGEYLFSGLKPGDYMVRFKLPAGYLFTLPNSGSDDGLDSDADATSGCTALTSLAEGENDMTWDAGIYKPVVEPPVVEPKPGALGNYVWVDLNEDGLQNDGQTGIANVTVELVRACTDVDPIATTTTSDTGEYRFSNLEAGDYIIRFILPEGYVFTKLNPDGDSELDSNADDKGCTTVITLEAGEEDMSWDAGVFEPTVPTGLPNGEQPQQQKKYIFLPAVQS